MVFQGGTLVQFDAAGAHQLAGGVRSASVACGSVAVGGLSEVLDVVFADGRLLQFDFAGAHQLGSNSAHGTVNSAGVALVPLTSDVLTVNTPVQEVLDAIFADGSLWQFDLSGAHELAAHV